MVRFTMASCLELVLPLIFATVFLSGCDNLLGRKNPIDAEGFGGGGAVDRANAKLVQQLTKYTVEGVPLTFCRPVAGCQSQGGSAKQCDLLDANINEESKSASCRAFFFRNLVELLALAKSTTIKVVDSNLTINAPEGIRSVDAYVPRGKKEIYIRSSFVNSASESDLLGLLGHEYGHLLGLARNSQLGDFDQVGAFEQAKDLFDTLGAAISVGLGAPAVGTYRKEVLKDEPFAYYAFEDRSGSLNLFDMTGRGRFGTRSGEFGFEHLSLKGMGKAGLMLPYGTNTFNYQSSSDFDPLRPVTLEFWLKLDSYARSYGIIASIGNVSLVVENNLLGFSRGFGHMVGTDVGNLGGRWTHVVAQFDPTDLSKNILYLDAVPRDLDHVYGSAAMTNTLEKIIYIDGRPETTTMRAVGYIDELAIYNYALSTSKISSHFAAQPGQVAAPVLSGNGFIGVLEGATNSSSWDEFLCGNVVCTYTIGAGNLTSIRQWIGHRLFYNEGENKSQIFRFTTETVPRTFNLTIYPIYNSSLDPWYARVVTGELQFKSNSDSHLFPKSYNPGPWNIQFEARSKVVEIRITNEKTAGNEYLFFDAFSLLPP